jgi:hypothetical protein
MTFLIIITLALLIIVLAYAVHKLVYERNSHQHFIDHLAKESEFVKAHSQAVSLVIENRLGGIHKRIDEIREITEVVKTHSPELFKDVPGLGHWLEASDEFLCALRDTAVPPESDRAWDEERNRFERHRTNAIYAAVRLSQGAA